MNDGTPRWATILKRRGTVLFEVLVAKGQSEKYYEPLFGFAFSIRNRKYLAGHIILDLNETARLRKLLEECLRKDPDYLNRLKENHYDQCRRILDIGKQLFTIRKPNKLSREEILQLFESYIEEVLKLMPSLMAMPTIEKMLEERLSLGLCAKLAESGKEQLLDDYLNSLIIPKKENYAAMELRELYEIAAHIQSSPELNSIFEETIDDTMAELERRPQLLSRLKDYSRKYGFLSMYTYEGHPMTLEDVVTKIKAVLQRDARNKSAEILEKRRASEEKYLEIIRELDLSEETQRLIELAREYLYLRLYRLDVLNIAGYYARNLLVEIGRRMELSYNELVYLSHQEIEAFLKTGALPVNEVIRQRRIDYGTVLSSGKMKVIRGKALQEALSAEKNLMVKPPERVDRLEGVIASKGRHTGRVRLVLYNPDVNKVENGDVIVSTMTNPYYVTAMIRAGAIVADEGGILSHAAIVSRELGIPCIVGTQVATKTLKDNDLVEVDATGRKGIVRIRSGEDD